MGEVLTLIIIVAVFYILKSDFADKLYSRIDDEIYYRIELEPEWKAEREELVRHWKAEVESRK